MHKDYFKMPLKFWFGTTKVFTSDSNMAFDFVCNMPDADKKGLLDIINGDPKKIKDNLIFTYKGGIISANDTPLVLIRSWGRLTGTGGGLALPPEKAVEIQDSFANSLIEKWSNACLP